MYSLHLCSHAHAHAAMLEDFKDLQAGDFTMGSAKRNYNTFKMYFPPSHMHQDIMSQPT